MLKFLRNKSHQKKIYYFIAVAVISTFLLGGIQFYNKGGEDGHSLDSALGKLDNKPVTVQDYLKSYKAVQHQVQLFYGDKANEAGRQLNLKGQAWDRILLLRHAKKEKLKTGDQEVVDWISKQFSLKGKFDEVLYKRYVEMALRSTPTEFEQEVRESLTISKVTEKLRTEISFTDDEIKKRYSDARRTRSLVYGFLPWESQKDIVKIQDEELQKIFDVVKNGLTEPGTERKLTYEESKAELTKIMTQDTATKEAVKKLAELRKDLNASNFEEQLGKSGAQIKTLESFKPGDELPLVGATSAKHFLDQIAALEEGEISEPFPVSGGGVIVKIIKNFPTDETKFNEEKESFRSAMVDEKLDGAMQKLLGELRAKLTLNAEMMKELFPSEDSK